MAPVTLVRDVVRSRQPPAMSMPGCGVAALLALGCGDSLIARDFRGPALATFESDLQIAGSLPSADLRLRIALFFSPAGPQSVDVGAMLEHGASARDATLPGVNTIHIFETPDPSLWVQPPTQPTGYALGRFLVYGDA